MKEVLTDLFGPEMAKPMIDGLYDTFATISAVVSTLYDMIFGSLVAKGY